MSGLQDQHDGYLCSLVQAFEMSSLRAYKPYGAGRHMACSHPAATGLAWHVAITPGVEVDHSLLAPSIYCLRNDTGPLFAQIAAGACHSLAITSTTGRLYTWGWSAQGQCGTGSTSDVLQPALCKALDGVPLADVAAGMAHSVVASRDGAVYTFGWNNNGQLGLGRTTVEPGQQQQQQLFSSLEPNLVEDPLLDDEHITKVGSAP